MNNINNINLDKTLPNVADLAVVQMRYSRI